VAQLPPFQVFLDSQREVVFRYLVARVGRQDAEDCFQETFLAALRAYPDLPTGANLKAWVLRIAERKSIDLYRLRARSPRPSDDLPERPEDGIPEVEPGLWAAVRNLPAKQQAAVLGRYVGDLSYAQIGRANGTSEEAARQNVREGLKKLRKVWVG
jgi:RNA polymerase sigma factor (sigma-70 family)